MCDFDFIRCFFASILAVGGGGEYYHYTPMCSGQYREAPSKKGTFFRPGEYKRLGKDSQAGVQ